MAGQTALSDNEMRRYMRQLVIQPFNGDGQAALKAAAVLIVGAGGLGSPVVAYLAAAGVGRLTIVDHDQVSVSNLNRQVLYRTADVAQSKAQLAAAFATALNPEVTAIPLTEPLDERNAVGLVADHDVVVDGTDNIASRRAVAEAALLNGKTLICGAVGQLEGFVTVFPPRGLRRPNGFDTLFPPVRGAAEASCEAVGTIGAVTGVIGSLMAMETIKVLSGLGTPVEGRVVRYDALSGEFRSSGLDKAPQRYLVGG